MPIFEIETDQGIFEIDADREPTQAEALQAIAGQGAPSVPRGTIQDQFPRMGRLPASTLGEQIQAANIGALEAAGRIPGELATVASQVAGNVLLPPAARSAMNVIAPGSADVLNQALQQATARYTAPIQNLTPKAFNALGDIIGQDIEFYDPNSPQIRNPRSALAGELIPQAASLFIRGPTGVSPAGTISEIPRAAASGVGQVGRSALEATFPKVAARTAPATVEQTAMAALDFALPQVERHIPIVTRQVSEIVGKTPKTAQEGLKFLKQAEDKLYKDRIAVNQQAAEQGLVAKGDNALQEARAILDEIPTITDDAKQAILRDLEPVYSGDKTPVQAQAIQQRLNKEFEAQYANGTFDRAAPANEAKLAIRDSFARQMDDINRAVTGSNETPYSDIGSIIEVRGGLQDKIRKLQGIEAEVKTGIEGAPVSGRIPLTKVGLTTKIARKALTPFQKSQLEKLDDAVQTIFTPSGKRIPPRTIPTVEEIDVLRGTYSPSQAPVQTLEQLIEQRIASYPTRIRNDPRVARAVARQQLIDEGLIPPQ